MILVSAELSVFFLENISLQVALQNVKRILFGTHKQAELTNDIKRLPKQK